MSLIDKLNVKAAKKYPIYTRKSPDERGKIDCPTRVRNKTKLREMYVAHWLLKYRKRYETIYGQ